MCGEEGEGFLIMCCAPEGDGLPYPFIPNGGFLGFV